MIYILLAIAAVFLISGIVLSGTRLTDTEKDEKHDANGNETYSENDWETGRRESLYFTMNNETRFEHAIGGCIKTRETLQKRIFTDFSYSEYRVCQVSTDNTTQNTKHR